MGGGYRDSDSSRRRSFCSFNEAAARGRRIRAADVLHSLAVG